MSEPVTTLPATGERCPQCAHEVDDAWVVCAWCGQRLVVPADLGVGSTLADGRYQVNGLIGRGGFGITYDAEDTRLERRVAIKELFPETAVRQGDLVLTPPEARPGFKAARDRFMREARVLARFTHPGIVRVFEVFEEHGTAYLVMEMVDGRNLVELLRTHGRPFGEPEILDLAGRVAAALRPVHAAGVLHRDVNPSNVMMTGHGRIVVIDFGLARDFHTEHTVGMTRVVTPGYAPLEQYRGEGRFGPSTDVYGLAATCYRLATGKVPVSAMERDGGVELRSPRSINAEISRGVSDAILDGLELEPAHRPQDLDSFLARLGVARLPQGSRALLLDSVDVAEPPEIVSVHGQPLAPEPGELAPARVGDLLPSGVAERAGEPVADPVAERSGEPVGEQVGRQQGWVREDSDATAAWSARDPDLTVGPARVARDPDLTVGPGPHDSDPAGVDRAAAWETSAPPLGAPLHRPAAAGPVPPSSERLDPARLNGLRPGERDVPVIGPHPPGRRKLTFPLAAVAVAAGAAAPVLVTAVMVAGAMPWLATLGDSTAHRLRASRGLSGGWAEQRFGVGLLAPVRFGRNLVMSIVRASPIIGVTAVLLAGWYGLEGLNVDRGFLQLGLRVIGVLMVGSLLAISANGSPRFRSGLGLDELTRRLVPGGRTNERLVIGWIVAAALVAASLWLTPDAFPLP